MGGAYLLSISPALVPEMDSIAFPRNTGVPEKCNSKSTGPECKVLMKGSKRILEG